MTHSSSLTADIYGQIRGDLLACRLRPGVRLKTIDLSVALGVSLGVVREALSRLTADGLVIAEPQRGFHAAPISALDLAQLTDATVKLEALCLERAIALGDAAWEGRIVDALHVLGSTPVLGSPPHRISEAYETAYRAFRDALVAACDNPWLLRLRRTLQAQGERYRHACMMLGPKTANPDQDYAALVAAVLARDAPRATMLLSERIRANSRLLADTLDEASPFVAPVRDRRTR